MVDDGSSCKSSIPLVARYPAGKENGVVLCDLKVVPDNILNVGQLGCMYCEGAPWLDLVDTFYSPSRVV